MNCTHCRDLGLVGVIEMVDGTPSAAVDYCDCPMGDYRWEEDVRANDAARRYQEEMDTFRARADAGELETTQAWLEAHP